MTQCQSSHITAKILLICVVFYIVNWVCQSLFVCTTWLKQKHHICIGPHILSLHFFFRLIYLLLIRYHLLYFFSLSLNNSLLLSISHLLSSSSFSLSPSSFFPTSPPTCWWKLAAAGTGWDAFNGQFPRHFHFYWAVTWKDFCSDHILRVHYWKEKAKKCLRWWWFEEEGRRARQNFFYQKKFIYPLCDNWLIHVDICQNFRQVFLGRHSTKVAFLLPTQPSRVRFFWQLAKKIESKNSIFLRKQTVLSLFGASTLGQDLKILACCLSGALKFLRGCRLRRHALIYNIRNAKWFYYPLCLVQGVFSKKRL